MVYVWHTCVLFMYFSCTSHVLLMYFSCTFVHFSVCFCSFLHLFRPFSVLLTLPRLPPLDAPAPPPPPTNLEGDAGRRMDAELLLWRSRPHIDRLADAHPLSAAALDEAVALIRGGAATSLRAAVRGVWRARSSIYGRTSAHAQRARDLVDALPLLDGEGEEEEVEEEEEEVVKPKRRKRQVTELVVHEEDEVEEAPKKRKQKKAAEIVVDDDEPMDAVQLALVRRMGLMFVG